MLGTVAELLPDSLPQPFRRYVVIDQDESAQGKNAEFLQSSLLL